MSCSGNERDPEAGVRPDTGEYIIAIWPRQ